MNGMEKREQDWMLLDYPLHAGFARFMKDLNKLYLEHSAFWEKIMKQMVSNGSTAIRKDAASMYLNAAAKKERMISLF